VHVAYGRGPILGAKSAIYDCLVLMYALYTNFILDANCPSFGILGPPGPVAAELCGHRGQMTQILELGIRAISVTPIIFDRSVFSYLKRTKMEDFDQKLSKNSGVLPPEPRGGRGPHHPEPSPVPAHTF